MAEITLEKLKPVLANSLYFSNEDVAVALLDLWLAKTIHRAREIAKVMIKRELDCGKIEKSTSKNVYVFAGACKCCGVSK